MKQTNKKLRCGNRKGRLGRNDQTHHRMGPKTMESIPPSKRNTQADIQLCTYTCRSHACKPKTPASQPALSVTPPPDATNKSQPQLQIISAGMAHLQAACRHVQYPFTNSRSKTSFDLNVSSCNVQTPTAPTYNMTDQDAPALIWALY